MPDSERICSSASVPAFSASTPSFFMAYCTIRSRTMGLEMTRVASICLMALTAISWGVRSFTLGGLARSSAKVSLLSPLAVFQLIGSMLNDGLPLSSLPALSSSASNCSSFRPSSLAPIMYWRTIWL
ncbi:hypothetical protein D9M72_112100 [compost metagenome]